MPKEESGKHSKDGADDSGRPQTDESNDREEPADDRSRPERNENSFRIPLVLLFPCVGMSVYAAHRLKLLNVTGMGLIGATSLYFFFFAPSPGKRKRGTGV